MTDIKLKFISFILGQIAVVMIAVALYTHYGLTVAIAAGYAMTLLVDIRFAAEKMSWRSVDRWSE